MKKILFKSLTFLIASIGIFLYAQVSANPASLNPSFDKGTPIGFNGSVDTQVVQNDGKIVVGGNFTSYQGVTSNRIIRLNSDGTKDYSFTIGSGFDALVRKILIQTDGKIVVGGNFHTYNGITANQIIRLNSDGSRDETFDSGSGFDGLLYSLAIQIDGKILVGGGFSLYRGLSATKLIRLNTDGSRDNTFDIIDGFDNIVKTIVIQDDGKIVVGGMFSSFDGSGSVQSCSDPQYTNQISCENEGYCDDLVSPDKATCEDPVCDDGISTDETACQDNGGNWGQQYTRTYNNTRTESNGANGIIRLNNDGSRDLNFAIGEGFGGGYVNRLVIQNNGKIIVGGTFQEYDGVSANRIARLNIDGTMDTDFITGIGFNDEVTSLLVQNDNKIVVGGMFSTYSGVSANRIARLNIDGTMDTNFIIGSGFNDTIYSLTLQSGGKILVGGVFTTYNGVAVSKITRLNVDGMKDGNFAVGNGFDNEIKIIIGQDDGKIIVGGTFISYNGIIANRIVRVNTNGTADTGFLMGNGFNSTVQALAIQDDEKIIVGGAFTTYSGVTANRITRLNSDGSIDTGFIIGSGFNNLINTLAIQDDGKIVVGGYFTNYNGTTANRITRLNSDGSIDTGFIIGGGFSNLVSAIAVQDDGKVIVGGAFATYSGVTANRITRLNSDGNIDTGFIIGSGFGGTTVSALAIQNNGKIVVGGNFSTYQGVQAVKIVRLNTDGLRDTEFLTDGGFNNAVSSLAIQDNGKILLGGSFTTYKSLSANKIICLYTDGSRDPNFDLGSGFNNTVNTITVKNNKEIIIGGLFTTYQNQTDPYIASIYGDSDLVILPNSSDDTIMKNEFTSKGYIQSGGDLIGSNAISLSETSGYIPVALNLKNQSIQLDIQANTQFTVSDSITNYVGIISMPTTKSIESINDESVVTAFNIGSQESLRLTGGVATLSAPVPTESVGDIVQVWYSEDNGVTWYPHIITNVVSDSYGNEYANFTTNHFTDFAVTVGSDSFAGSFVINDDDASTDSKDTTLSISSTPAAGQMRFSNDNATRTSWEAYATTKARTLSNNAGTKTVYIELDLDNDDDADVYLSDTISYEEEEITPPTGGGGGTLVQDQCPNTRDCSDSYYDNLCGKCTLIETIVDILPFHNTTDPITGDIENSTYGDGLNTAYLRAYQYGITTMPSIQKANIEGTLIRKDMAKMITNFAVNVLKKDFSTGTTCEFSDTTPLTKEAQYYAIAACRLGLMGYESDGVTLKKSFDPEMEVDRSQFGTILSRLLRGNKYNGGTPYYAKHLQALKTEKIMTKIENPSAKEMRGWVMVMMQRIFKTR